jgi:PKD repeat protein
VYLTFVLLEHELMRTQFGRLGLMVVATVCGVTLALYSPHFSAKRFSWFPIPAYACGLGQTATMVANGSAALAYPGTAAGSPIGVFAAEYHIGQAISFSEDLSRFPTPLDPSQFGWQWDFGDGISDTGFPVNHTYHAAGTYAVHVKVINQGVAGPDFDSAQIVVSAQAFDHPPVAKATASAQYVQLGGTVTYDAVGSSALVGGDLTYTWNFGDNTTATGPQVIHRFQTLGQGFVALIVQDSRGARSYATVPVNIVPQLPAVRLAESATTIKAGGTVTFDASGSTAPKDRPNNRLIAYRWSFGDGTSQQTAQPKISHAYTRPGTYIATLQALDRREYPGAASVVITVTGSPQTASQNPLGQLAGYGIFALIVAAGAWLAWRNRKKLVVKSRA